MGNCVEETGASSLIDAILTHPSNKVRDQYTAHATFLVLEKKNVSELKKILDDLNAGDKLPDNFR